LLCAISIVCITPDNDNEPGPKFWAKQPIQIAFWFLNKPPQAAIEDVPAAALSMLHFIQLKVGGCQTTSMMLGGLGRWIVILKFLRIENSEMKL